MREPLALYRALLRARAKAFAGDVRALAASRSEIREKFEASRDVDDALAAQRMREGREAEEFIRLHVVQAVRDDAGGAFKMRVEPSHVDVTIEGARESESGSGCEREPKA
jgi:complex III assembly factor LYRM7